MAASEGISEGGQLILAATGSRPLGATSSCSLRLLLLSLTVFSQSLAFDFLVAACMHVKLNERREHREQSKQTKEQWSSETSSYFSCNNNNNKSIELLTRLRPHSLGSRATESCEGEEGILSAPRICKSPSPFAFSCRKIQRTVKLRNRVASACVQILPEERGLVSQSQRKQRDVHVAGA